MSEREMTFRLQAIGDDETARSMRKVKNEMKGLTKETKKAATAQTTASAASTALAAETEVVSTAVGKSSQKLEGLIAGLNVFNPAVGQAKEAATGFGAAFGPVGVAIGAVAGIALPMLIERLSQATTAQEDMQEATEGATDAIREQARALGERQRAQQLAAQVGSGGGSIEQQQEARNLAFATRGSALQDAVAAITAANQATGQNLPAGAVLSGQMGFGSSGSLDSQQLAALQQVRATIDTFREAEEALAIADQRLSARQGAEGVVGGTAPMEFEDEVVQGAGSGGRPRRQRRGRSGSASQGQTADERLEALMTRSVVDPLANMLAQLRGGTSMEDQQLASQASAKFGEEGDLAAMDQKGIEEQLAAEEAKLAIMEAETAELEKQAQLMDEQADAAAEFADQLAWVGSLWSSTIKDVIAGEKTLGEAIRDNFIQIMQQLGEQMIGEGFIKLFQGLFLAVQGNPQGAAMIGIGGAQIAVGTGLLAGGSAAAASTSAGGGGSAAPVPAAGGGADDGGGGGVTIIQQINDPVDEARLGRIQEGSARAARRHFGGRV